MRIHFVLALSALNNSSNLANRVLLALFAVKLGASPIIIGILGAMFAVFPSLLAVMAGRLNDRFGSRYLLIGGTIGTAMGMLMPYFWPSLSTILFAALMCGFSQVFFSLSTQNLTGLLSTPETRARNFSNYSLTASTGQFLGPIIGGFTIDHLSNTYACLALAVFSALPLLMLAARRGPLEPRHAASRNKGKKATSTQAGGAWVMLKNSEVRRTLYTGSLLNSGGNLYLFYMPVYAHSVGISASVIGLIMAMQASAAFVVRMVLPRLIQAWREDKVLAIAFAMGAISLTLIPFFQNAWVLALLSFAFGLGMGVGGPIVTMQMFVNSAEGRSGEGIGLKMTTNQLTKLVSPVAFGAVATAFGLNPMFWLNALLLATGGYLSRSRRKPASPGATPPV